MARARGHRRHRADGHPRRDHREHRAALGLQGSGHRPATQQWIVTAYTLTFGGFLLLGGRIADFWGRKRTYLTGAVGFAVASALGGLAQNEAMLFAARALQGAFGALLAPASLALLTVLFTDTKERAKAFAVYGAIAGGGSAVGLLLGGVLTEYADWRWCFWVNLPVAIVGDRAGHPDRPGEQGARRHQLRHPRRGAGHPRPGLVRLRLHAGGPERRRRTPPQGVTDTGWADPWALLFIGVGVLLVAAFVVLELRTRNPLLPMRHRARPQPRRRVPDLDPGGGGADRRVLLPQPLLPAGAALQAGRGRVRLAAHDARRVRRRRRRQRPGAPDRPEAADGGRRPARRGRAVH